LEKRILVYTNHYYPENFKINDVVRWIKDDNHHIRVITQIPNYPNGDFYKGYGVFLKSNQRHEKQIINRLPVIPRGSGTKLLLILNYISYFISSFFFTVYLLIFVKKYDYIIVHHTSPPLLSIHPILYGLFYKTKKIYWELDVWPETLQALGIIKSNFILGQIKKIMIKIYSYYDLILIGSNQYKEIIKQRYNGQIQYFPNWADQTIEEKSDNKIVDINVPKDHKIIMYTGNIGYAQNFDQIIKLCFKTINEKIYWVFIGDGRFKFKLSQILDNNPKLKIKLIDSVKIDLIKSYIHTSDFTLLSLSSKGIFNKTVPAKLQTYMCLSKPVIGFVSGEAKEIISNANCGIVIDSFKIDESVEKIIELVNFEKSKIKRLGENGRRYYEKYFNSKFRQNQLKKIIV
jgi:glycosyltransferase involved in cell wall biosynthesis